VRYARAVAWAGGLPLGLVATPGFDFAEHARCLMQRLDGLLISGGDDFETEPLGLGPTHPEAVPVPRVKQDFDVALARAALDAGLPVLGICYGMQCLGLAEGATLFQHLPEDRPGARDHRGDREHGVRALEGTKLAELMGLEDSSVVSRHHQALRSVASPWRISATDDEGGIEAIERRNHPFALGVQWHPELPDPTFPGGSLQGRLFEALIEAARAAARTTAATDLPRAAAFLSASP
jgi:gamma-glutamyl-gamma-aminobutyrate hydrolase PuuD